MAADKADSPLVDILSPEYYEIQQSILRHLDIEQIVNLTRVCKRLLPLYASNVSRHWNINKALSRYFTDPVTFRRVLGFCGAIISGPFARDFFSRERVETEGRVYFRIYVQYGADQPLTEHMIQNEQYRRSGTGSLTHDTITYRRAEGKSFQDFQWFQRPGSPESAIQIMLTKAPPVLAVMRAEQLTAAFQIITASVAVSFFPRLTFISNLTSALSEDTFRSVLGPLSLYRLTVNQLLRSEDDEFGKLLCDRRVGDSKCWTIDIDPSGMQHTGYDSTDRKSNVKNFRLGLTRPGEGEMQHHPWHRLNVEHAMVRVAWSTLEVPSEEQDDNDNAVSMEVHRA